MKVMRAGPAGFGEATPSAPKNAATSAFGGTGKPGGGILPLATRSRTFSQVAGVCCGALKSTGAQIQVRGLQLCVVTGEAMRRGERLRVHGGSHAERCAKPCPRKCHDARIILQGPLTPPSIIEILWSKGEPS